MINFIIGIIVGFFITTYGVSGVAQAVDTGIKTIKNVNISVEK